MFFGQLRLELRGGLSLASSGRAPWLLQGKGDLSCRWYIVTGWCS